MSRTWPQAWDETVETISRDELHTLQVVRLRPQLERCYASSSFYRDKLRQATFAEFSKRIVEREASGRNGGAAHA